MGNEFDKPVTDEFNSGRTVRLGPSTLHPYPPQVQRFQAEQSSDDDDEDATTDDHGRLATYDPDSFAAAADPSALEHDGDKPIIAKGVKGYIKWYNFKNGFGFIFREDTFEDLFVHRSAIKKAHLTKKDLMPNQTVEFEVVLGDKGFEAANLTITRNNPASDGQARTSGSNSNQTATRSPRIPHSTGNQEEFYDFEYEDSDEEDDDDDENADEDEGAEDTQAARYYSPSASASHLKQQPQKCSIAMASAGFKPTVARVSTVSAPATISVKESPLVQETEAIPSDYDFEKQLEKAIALSLQDSLNAQDAKSDESSSQAAAFPKCKLCEEEYAVVLFEPCSHSVCCLECSIRLKRCPDCAAVIEKKTDTTSGEQVAISSKIKTTDLLEKVNALEEAQKCTICMDKRKNMAFDCGHMTCDTCSNSLRQCPLCRKMIRTKTKLYEP